MPGLKSELKSYARSIGVDHLSVGEAAPFDEVAQLLHAMHSEGTYPAFTERDIRGAHAAPTMARRRQEHHRHRRLLSHRRRASPAEQGDSQRPRLPIRLGRRLPPDPPSKVEADRRLSSPSESIIRSGLSRTSIRGPPSTAPLQYAPGSGGTARTRASITPRHGSYVFLAQVVTNVALEPDPPMSRSCGTCDRCIRACPTGAIERPFWVNPNKCLSYITQMPGMIPKEYRKAMGRHLWGCDVCQIVCPWNWEAEADGDDAFRPSEELTARPALIPLLTMTNSQFRKWFGPTAMGWRGKKIIQRNACICLGNIGDPAAVPALIDRLFHDAKAEVRASAAWALGEIGGCDAHEALCRALKRENDPFVTGEIADALQALAAPAALQPAKSGPEASRRLEA